MKRQPPRPTLKAFLELPYNDAGRMSGLTGSGFQLPGWILSLERTHWERVRAARFVTDRRQLFVVVSF